MTDAAEIARKAAPIGHGKLQWRILIGFVAGLVAGLATYSFASDAAWTQPFVTYVTGPIGQVFLRLLFMLVIPLLFSALVSNTFIAYFAGTIPFSQIAGYFGGWYRFLGCGVDIGAIHDLGAN